MSFLNTGSHIFHGTGITNNKACGKLRFVNQVNKIDKSLKKTPKEEAKRFKIAIEKTVKE